MSESCKVCGAQFQEPLSLIAHLTSHGPRLDSTVLGVDYPAYSEPETSAANWRLPDCAEVKRWNSTSSCNVWQPPDDEETLSRCSPLNLARPDVPPGTGADFTCHCGAMAGLDCVCTDASVSAHATATYVDMVNYDQCYLSAAGGEDTALTCHTAITADSFMSQTSDTGATYGSEDMTQSSASYTHPIPSFNQALASFNQANFISEQVVNFEPTINSDATSCQSAYEITAQQHQDQMENANEQAYRCSVCPESFQDKESLKTHVEAHNAKKLYACDTCGLRLSSKWSWWRHRLVHTPEAKPHQCTTCTRRYSTKHDLSRHQLQHQREPVKCDRCNRHFLAPHHMASHKCNALKPRSRVKTAKPVSGDPVRCSLCSQMCANRVAWGFHMWRHTKDPHYLPDLSAGFGGAGPDKGNTRGGSMVKSSTSELAKSNADKAGADGNSATALTINTPLRPQVAVPTSKESSPNERASRDQDQPFVTLQPQSLHTGTLGASSVPDAGSEVTRRMKARIETKPSTTVTPAPSVAVPLEPFPETPCCAEESLSHRSYPEVTSNELITAT